MRAPRHVSPYLRRPASRSFGSRFHSLPTTQDRASMVTGIAVAVFLVVFPRCIWSWFVYSPPPYQDFADLPSGVPDTERLGPTMTFWLDGELLLVDGNATHHLPLEARGGEPGRAPLFLPPNVKTDRLVLPVFDEALELTMDLAPLVEQGWDPTVALWVLPSSLALEEWLDLLHSAKEGGISEHYLAVRVPGGEAHNRRPETGTVLADGIVGPSGLGRVLLWGGAAG